MGHTQSENSPRCWYLGNVPFEIDDVTLPVGSTERVLVVAAIDQLNAKTRINLCPRASESSYIKFVKVLVPGTTSSATSDFIGMQGGMQLVHLNDAFGADPTHPFVDTNAFTVAHEIMHAIGVYHEHTRTDRDSFVRINWENIDPIYVGNFLKVNKTLRGAYDYDSIMHYPRGASLRRERSSGACSSRRSTASSTIPLMTGRLGIRCPRRSIRPRTGRSLTSRS